MVSTQTVVPGTNFGGRAPFEMLANVTLGGVTRQVRFIAVHAKASGDLDSYNKRVAGAAQLKAYRSGMRRHEVMAVIAKPLSDDEIESLAAWYSSQKISVQSPP